MSDGQTNHEVPIEAVIYVRRSANREGDSLEAQREQCREYCQAHGWSVSES